MVKVKPAERSFGLWLAFHSVGIGCLTGSIFLQFLIFFKISSQGAFIGIEKNPLILNSEMAMTAFCVIYLLYVALASLRTLVRSRRRADDIENFC